MGQANCRAPLLLEALALENPDDPLDTPAAYSFFLSFFLSFNFSFFVVYFQAPAVRCATKRDEQQIGQQQHDEQFSSSIARLLVACL